MNMRHRRYPIGHPADIRPGAAYVVSVDGIEIGVFKLGERVVAYRNHCPHQGAPVCTGRVGGTTLPSAPGEYVYGRRDEVLHCPWHHWQFDLSTGEALFGQRVRLARVEVAVEDEEVVIYLPAAGAGTPGTTRSAPVQEASG
ncbi:MAG TPA: Rieske (2Fe-2S) protein [Chloroflexota bacterium]|jgi:nitrite reductase/ring-hydroxylating ferredoxin subunit|nr:Rieske (2Fe-2S) protein [Chloroflexota bacterium]